MIEPEFFQENRLDQGLEYGSALNGGVLSIVPGTLELVLAYGLIVTVITIILHLFVINPVEVGGCSFYTQNARNRTPGAREMLQSFSSGYYGNVVLTMLFRDLFILLWSLLLIIPGVIKAYQYRMIPYLMADHPDMDHQEAFEVSRQMMEGNKWDAFVLDLSFIGWNFLSVITLGLVGIFWTNPYYYQTCAQLYLALSGSENYD